VLEDKTNQPVIIARGLVKSYGSKRALNGVDLEISAGGITAILGSNGAGKTTLINCALGLTGQSKGDIRVLGQKAGHSHARQRTGTMLQNSDLPDLLTARENIELMASYYPEPRGLDEVLDICEMRDFCDVQYKKLSGGQKRRVQFALAIVGRPQLIFLDEPTTGLDSDARRILWKTVRTLAEQDVTIILTTHYLEEADALADRIIVMNEGRIIADAPTPDIRNTVGGALIRCVTQLDEGRLASLNAIRSVKFAGRFAEMLSTDAVTSLRALLAIDPELSDLTIERPSLEEAFLGLTRTSNRETDQ
jgi:ABC-2 type transport system ATP-binding protein